MTYKITVAATRCLLLTTAFCLPTFAQDLNKEESLLNKYPGFSYNADYEALQYDQEKARTQIISSCMEEAGFKYIQGEYFEIEVGSNEVLTAADAEAIVEQLRLKDELYEKQLPEDAAGYYKALYGTIDMDNPGPEFLDTIQSGGGGCFGRAEREVVSVFAISSNLTKEYTEAMYAVYDDSRYKEAESEWASCISKSGYVFENPIALRTAVVSGVGMETVGELTEGDKADILEVSNRCISEAKINQALVEAKALAEKNFYLKHRNALEKSLDQIPALREQVNQILK